MGLFRVGEGRFVEAQRDETVLRTPDDAALIIEACLSARINAALLYPENLTPQFFDLSSGDAGAVVNKLRRFGIRLAIICAPGSAQFSTRFHEFVADDFKVFDTVAAAREWLVAQR